MLARATGRDRAHSRIREMEARATRSRSCALPLDGALFPGFFFPFYFVSSRIVSRMRAPREFSRDEFFEGERTKKERETRATRNICMYNTYVGSAWSEDC